MKHVFSHCIHEPTFKLALFFDTVDPPLNTTAFWTGEKRRCSENVGIGSHIKRKRSGCIRVDAVNGGAVLSGLTVVTYLLFRDSKEKIFSTRSD